VLEGSLLRLLLSGCDHPYIIHAKADDELVFPKKKKKNVKVKCIMCSSEWVFLDTLIVFLLLTSISHRIVREEDSERGFCHYCFAHSEAAGLFTMLKTDESTKCAVLKSTIVDILALPGNQKTVVFSSFKRLLDLAADFLGKDMGLKIARCA